MKRLTRAVLGVGIAAVFVLPAQANPLIVPGHSLGNLAIGANAEKVWRTMPAPDTTDAAMGKYWATWKSKSSRQPDGTPNVLDIYSKRNDEGDTVFIEQVRVTSSYFHTRSGISTRSTLNAIRRAFPNAKRIAYFRDEGSHLLADVYDDVKSGIAFEWLRGQRCLAITVHRRGRKITDSGAPRHEYHTIMEKAKSASHNR
jgi:hypothetical protein